MKKKGEVPVNDEPDLGRMIGYCAHLGMRYNDRQLRRAGDDVTPVQSHVLLYLSCLGSDREANQRDLERELHLKPSTVNGIVGRLEEKGYISRRASPADGRCRLVTLTEAGQKKANAFRAVLTDTDRRFSFGLTAEEEALLRSLLSRVIANLESEVNKGNEVDQA